MLIIQIVSAALTPIIAIIVAYIAYRQFKVDSLRFRHEIYDRRLSVFRELNKFLISIVTESKADLPMLREFYANTSEAEYLFKSEIPEYIKDLYSKGKQLVKIDRKLEEKSNSKDVESIVKLNEEKLDFLNKFSDEIENAREKFKKYLSLTK